MSTTGATWWAVESDPPFPEGDKRQFGYSRDKRPDCVQVVIALVVTPQGELLGTVDHLIETGANDVLVVRSNGVDDPERELLIPFAAQYVTAVDVAARLITVDWDTDW